MKKLLFGFFIFLFLSIATAIPLYAAMVRTGESVYLPENEKNLHDLYLFSNDITVDAPVTNDLVAAGNTLTVNGEVSGNMMAAGSDIVIRSHVNGSVRTAGGTIVISGPIDRDLLIAGGDIRVTRDASISGDLLFAGGTLRLEGFVKGNVHANGGSVIIDAPVNGNVEGKIGELKLGKNAKINGNIRYISSQKAKLEPGAHVTGQHQFRQQEQQKQPTGIASAFSSWALYKLAVDIIISILLVTFTPLLAKATLERAVNKPAASAGIGFLLLIFIPFFSIFLFFLFWLGIASLLFYGLLLLLSMFFEKLLIGWWIIRWWSDKNKKEYTLDWKAAIVGSLVSFILILIPVLGWLVLFVIYLLAFGALTRTIVILATKTELPEIKHKK